MQAAIGDELVVRGRRVGDPDRAGVIIAIQGQNGAPPYVVRWTDGHQSVFMPESDTIVEHLPAAKKVP